MKKIKKIILVFAILTMLPIGVFAKEKVNVYLFKREGCGFCANALSFFTALSEDAEYQNYFNLVAKDVLNSKENSELMEKSAKKLGVEISGVPFIVIGTEYFEGYSNTFDDQIKSVIKNAYENESEDIVASLIGSEDDNSSAITIIILLAVVAGIAFLIYMAKENGSEEQEEKSEEEEKIVQEVVSKKQPVTKKTTTKATSATTKKTSSKTSKSTSNKTTTTKKNTAKSKTNKK